MSATENLPCPFCGEKLEVPPDEEMYGTQYELECECGLAATGVQICDLMTIEERQSDDFIDYRYGLEFIARARVHCLEQWNKRATL